MAEVPKDVGIKVHVSLDDESMARLLALRNLTFDSEGQIGEKPPQETLEDGSLVGGYGLFFDRDFYGPFGTKIQADNYASYLRRVKQKTSHVVEVIPLRAPLFA